MALRDYNLYCDPIVRPIFDLSDARLCPVCKGERYGRQGSMADILPSTLSGSPCKACSGLGYVPKSPTRG